MDKAAKLAALADNRRGAPWEGYRALADYHEGKYDCHHVSPYTKSAGNVDAEVMVMLQDWSSDLRLSGPFDQEAAELGYTPGLPTNRHLSALLRENFQLPLSAVYATNLFPFIKRGALSAGIPAKDLVRAAREFAVPQIDIVRPRLVICLGLRTFNALRQVVCGGPLQTLAAAIEQPFAYGTASVWCQAHTGQLGRNNRNRGGVDRVSQDWARMRAALSIGPR